MKRAEVLVRRWWSGGAQGRLLLDDSTARQHTGDTRRSRSAAALLGNCDVVSL